MAKKYQSRNCFRGLKVVGHPSGTLSGTRTITDWYLTIYKQQVNCLSQRDKALSHRVPSHVPPYRGDGGTPGQFMIKKNISLSKTKSTLVREVFSFPC